MVERGGPPDRVRTWAPAGPGGLAQGRRRAPALPAGLLDPLAAHGALARQVLARWIALEIAPGRLFAWIPVAFGLGVVLYFTAEREPAWWAAGALALACATGAAAARRHAAAFAVLLAAAAASAGFATATIRTALIVHPVLQRPVSAVHLKGFVEVREETERSDRIVLRVQEFDGARAAEKPERVRVSVHRGKAPKVGTFVALQARLAPPREPLRPGGYDLARALYFQSIGASGLVTGEIKEVAAPARATLWLRYTAAVEQLRDAIDARIRALVPGDAGSIASALITGKRDAISAPVFDGMFISGIGHVLSISGYHMAVVAGVVFFVMRAGLALIPSMASRYPIKKWAALAALLATTFYLILSGAEVATQRSYIMIGIVLIGVMVDRTPLTFRTLALAALAVLLLAPEAVVHPSFQMSFAATLALVALYQGGLPLLRPGRETSLGAKLALWGVREVVGLVLASLFAGFATMPYAAYHFHRLAPYGVLANLLAMPIVSAWVMPAGILALLAMPFGFDAPLWRLMGNGIDWMDAVALWVASLPGAVGRMAAFGTGPLLIATAGLILVCLLRSPLRWCGAAMLIVAGMLAFRAPQPDVLIANDGRTFAVRTAQGRLAVLRSGYDVLTVHDWFAADADPRTGKEQDLASALSCDPAGCIGRLAGGRIVAIALTAEAFAEDCRRAAVVMSARTAPPGCVAVVLDRDAWRAHGAIALRATASGFAVAAAKPAGTDRPWARAVAGAGAGGASILGPAVKPRAPVEPAAAPDYHDASD